MEEEEGEVEKEEEEEEGEETDKSLEGNKVSGSENEGHHGFPTVEDVGEDNEEEILRGTSRLEETESLVTTPIKGSNDEYTPSEMAEIETCSTCSLVSSTGSKRRIRGGKKHNKIKRKETNLLPGSKE